MGNLCHIRMIQVAEHRPLRAGGRQRPDRHAHTLVPEKACGTWKWNEKMRNKLERMELPLKPDTVLTYLRTPYTPSVISFSTLYGDGNHCNPQTIWAAGSSRT